MTMTAASLLCAVLAAFSSREETSIEALCAQQPEAIAGLFAALDLTPPALDAVERAVASADWPLACTALLGYYRDRFREAPGLDEAPGFAAGMAAEADKIVAGEFTFYTVSGVVPLRPDGGLDWSYQGPNRDREWAWALNRHRHIARLLDAYLATGKPEYVKAIDAHLHDWVTANPYPGKKGNSAPWRGLEVAHRLDAWADVFVRLLNDPHLTDATRILLLSSLPNHAQYLRNFHAAGNWVTMEMNGLSLLATTWPEFAGAAAWNTYAVDKMTAELATQIYPDGVQMELTSHYHEVVVRQYESFARRYRALDRPLPSVFNETLDRMWSYLAYTMRPDGFALLNNDSDRTNTRAIVPRAADAYGREDWRYIASNGAEGQAPTAGPSVFYPWAGQAVLRSGWDAGAHWTFFDVGPFGTGHQHHDKLHLSIAAYGRDLLVDSGRYTYVGGPERSYMLGSAGHNTLLIDGQGQGRFTLQAAQPLEGVHRFTETMDYVRGHYDEGYKNVEGTIAHTRVLVYVRNEFWIVIDSVETDRPRTITAPWHFHPRCTLAVEGRSAMSTDAGKGNLRIQPLGDVDWTLELVKGQKEPAYQGWYSDHYNHIEASPTAVYSASINGRATFGWLLIPHRDLPPSVETEWQEVEEGAVRVRVRPAGGPGRSVSIPLSGPPTPTLD